MWNTGASENSVTRITVCDCGHMAPLHLHQPNACDGASSEAPQTSAFLAAQQETRSLNSRPDLGFSLALRPEHCGALSLRPAEQHVNVNAVVRCDGPGGEERKFVLSYVEIKGCLAPRDATKWRGC
ncbi:hypothetical protein EYF80_001899 [Liparis tanakae]|uniref:Uncharacterized protein n=1 Tax=Liparis tanakae TaxID=230148 RepID=A0A4Z2JCA0_9TELE|nr:hypothetical protein EYF80_001899 [Liparis tanakae]